MGDVRERTLAAVAMIRAAFIVLLLAGCASAPPANQALDQARAAHRAAQTDSAVLRYAAAELDAASRTFGEAERAPSTDEAAHLAYLAEQRPRIAPELGQARANEQQAPAARLHDAGEEAD